MSHKQLTRREALKAAGAAVAVPYLLSSSVIGLGGQPGANEKVTVAIIGLGGRAHSIVDESRGMANFRIAAVCDCFAPRIDKFVKDVGKDQNWKTYERLPPDVREGEARRRDGRDHHARPGVDRDPRHAGRAGHVHREAHVPDDRRRPLHGQGRAEVQARHAGRHAAAVDADQQLGQRPGEERRAGQGPHGAGPELRRPGQVDRTSRPSRMPKGGSERLVGHLDQPGRVAALSSRSCTTAGTAGGTTTAAAAASA